MPGSTEQASQILIVGDKSRVSEDTEAALLRAGVRTRRVASTRAGCALAGTGQFQVVIVTESLFDGAWKRLIEMAGRSRPGFEVIVVANEHDTNQRRAALQEGVFEFLDASSELPRLGEVVRSALWAAYLEGAGPRPNICRGVDS